jgi:hypothetical protein
MARVCFEPMDSALRAAAIALSRGNPLAALPQVALRGDASALALRGIAMAQLRELERARLLLGRAARAFGRRRPVERARALLAQAEVALATRDLETSGRALASVCETLEAAGDRVNAAHARLLMVRRLLLLGRLEPARRALGELSLARLPAALLAMSELLVAGIELRRLRPRAARTALSRARLAAVRSAIPALLREVEVLGEVLAAPAAHVVQSGVTQSIGLDELEQLLLQTDIVVDGCRRQLTCGAARLSLARRPVLFALLAELAREWPNEVPRARLIARAFGVNRPNDSHRARLRVELGRLRRLVKELAQVEATRDGFVLAPKRAKKVLLLEPPSDAGNAALLALLADGQAWSTSALALALGASQRTVQRALGVLEAEGQVTSLGRARARRWLYRPLAGASPLLLLPAAALVRES